MRCLFLFSSLPEKVRSCILSHYLDFENISLQLRRKPHLKVQDGDVNISSILDLPDDDKYRRLRRRNDTLRKLWPDNVERAFLVGKRNHVFGE